MLKSERFNEHGNISDQRTVIRKFISPAVYVEKSVMAPSRKKSSVQVDSNRSEKKNVKMCTCVTSRHCPCHENAKLETNSDCSTSSTDGSQITIKLKQASSEKNEEKLTLDLNSIAGSMLSVEANEREEKMRQWLKKKSEEKRLKEIKEAKEREERDKERELMLQRERENFRKWLLNKKKQEEKTRKEKQRLEEERQKIEEEKERKRAENEQRYKAWLIRKRRVELEKKIKEKLAVLQVCEEKQKRLAENEKAFDGWLKSSKNKPKPIPLNQGLKSLCSSTSVTYINPVPWNPNIENFQKPVSQ